MGARALETKSTNEKGWEGFERRLLINSFVESVKQERYVKSIACNATEGADR